ncbi:unnamed protein product [Trichobilharzia szidati]|nr:unnamed protein product [Trichobilharzia szidati]
MHCITSVLSNPSKQTTESHQMTRKSLSPSSPLTQVSEELFHSSMLTRSMVHSSPTSFVSSSHPSQSTGLGVNSTKPLTSNLNTNVTNNSSGHLPYDPFKCKVNLPLQDGDSRGIYDTSALVNSQNLLSSLPSVCFGISNDSLLNQIANGQAANLLSMSTPFPSEICLNKFPDSLVRNWTEGFTATNTQINNPPINTSQSINMLTDMSVSSAALSLKCQSSDIPLSINDTTLESPDNLVVYGSISDNSNNHYSLEKSKTTLSDTESMQNNNFSVISTTAYQNSCLESNKSRISSHHTTGGGGSITQNSTTRKSDEDFCDLCQKHFCNKYYLRKHKIDVHGIHTEPYSHSRRRAGETQIAVNTNHTKSINLSVSNIGVSTATISNASVITPPLIGNNSNNSVMLNGDSLKTRDKSKGLDFSVDYDKCKLNDFQCDSFKPHSPTKFEFSNKSLSSIYDYMNCGSNLLNENIIGSGSNQWKKNCISTTNINTLSSIKNTDNNNGVVGQAPHPSELNLSLINSTNSTCLSPSFDVNTTTINTTNKYNVSSEAMLNINDQCSINSSVLETKNLNPLLSAHHYYMMALAANFSSSTANLLNGSEMMMMKSSLTTNKFTSNLDIPFLPIPASLDMNNIALQEAQCDQCHKVFCNEYFLQLHRLSHQSNSDGSLTRSDERNFDACEDMTTEIKEISNIGRKTTQQCDNEKSEMDTENDIGLDFNLRKRDREETDDENDSHLFPSNKFAISDMNMSYSRSSEFRISGGHSLDAFKNSMVAAKLADRVTCELCNKELCNKYFLRTHKIRVHGVSPKDVGGPPMRNPPVIENSSLSYPLNESRTTGNCITTSQETNSSLNYDDNCKTDPAFCEDIMNSFSSAYSTLGMVNQFLPFAYWPLFAANQFVSEKAVNCQMDKTLLPGLDSVATWNSLNNPMSSDMYNRTESTQNLALPEIPSAVALISCPLCDMPIGPRLFLPTHLNSVHKLCPTDPDFFMNMLRAKPMTKAELITDGKISNYWSTIFPSLENKQLGSNNDNNNNSNNLQLKSASDTFQKDLDVHHQPSNNDMGNGRNSPSDKSEDVLNMNTFGDNLIIKELQPFVQKTEIPSISTQSVISSGTPSMKTSDDALQVCTALSSDCKTEMPTTESQLPSNFLTSNPLVSTTNLMPFFPLNLTKTAEEALSDNLDAGMNQSSQSSACGNADSKSQPSIASAAAAAAVFSGLPFNPVAAANATNCARPWNAMSHLSTTSDSSNYSTLNQPNCAISPTNSTGVASSSLGHTGVPRKSPNQMRVLCDICNKWICNKYFLRTHKANKHGITDLSLGSLENYRPGLGKSTSGIKSHMHTSFRKASNQCVRDSPHTDDNDFINCSNLLQTSSLHPVLTTPCESQQSLKSVPSLQECQTHNSEQKPVIIDNPSENSPPVCLSECNDISGINGSLPLTFQPTVPPNLPWLGYGFPNQSSSSIGSYTALSYPSMIPFPLLPNSDIHSYSSQTEITGKLATSDLALCTTDSEMQNEEDKDPLNLSLKVSEDNLNKSDEQGSYCATTTTTTAAAATPPPPTTTAMTTTHSSTAFNIQETMTNNPMDCVKRGHAKKYFKNYCFISYRINRARKMIHYKLNKRLLCLQMKRKQHIQDVRGKFFTKRKTILDKRCEQKANWSKNQSKISECQADRTIITPRHSVNIMTKSYNLHHRQKQMQRKVKQRSMKQRNAVNKFLGEDSSSISNTASLHVNDINILPPMNNEIQYISENQKNNDSLTNGGKLFTPAIKSPGSILPTQIFCPLCLDGEAFTQPSEFMLHLKQKHPVSECESVMNLFKTQLELYNSQNLIFQINNLAASNGSLKSAPLNTCNNVFALSPNNMLAVSSSSMGNTESVNTTSWPETQNEIIYGIQPNNNNNNNNSNQNKSLNSLAFTEPMETTPPTCCYPASIVSQSSVILSSSPSPSSLPMCSSIASSISNPIMPTSRSLGRPLFMPVNSFTKTLSTI